MRKRGPKIKTRVAKVPAQAIPRAPKKLDVEARKHWNQVADLVNGMGLGSACDAVAMSLYIAIWSRWQKALKKLDDAAAADPWQDGGGLTIGTVNKYRQLNPWYTIAYQSEKELKAYLNEFGLTPKARAKLVLPDDEEVDEKWEEFDDDQGADPEDE